MILEEFKERVTNYSEGICASVYELGRMTLEILSI